jgi:hypothetical protein
LRVELEHALRELEVKLPELRHLISEAELQLTLSEEVGTTAARLLCLVTQADEVASHLRRELLSGTGLVTVTPGESPSEAPLTEADYELVRVLGDPSGDTDEETEGSSRNP